MTDEARAGRVVVATPVPLVPLRELLPWLVLAGLLLVLQLWLAGADQGALSLVPGEAVHEYLHDARHVLGFPCD